MYVLIVNPQLLFIIMYQVIAMFGGRGGGVVGVGILGGFMHTMLAWKSGKHMDTLLPVHSTNSPYRNGAAYCACPEGTP